MYYIELTKYDHACNSHVRGISDKAIPLVKLFHRYRKGRFESCCRLNYFAGSLSSAEDHPGAKQRENREIEKRGRAGDDEKGKRRELLSFSLPSNRSPARLNFLSPGSTRLISLSAGSTRLISLPSGSACLCDCQRKQPLQRREREFQALLAASPVAEVTV